MAVLNQIQVTGLLGRFKHKVDFPEGDSFVILHGPNGVGKTHLLKLVHAVLSGEFWHLDAIRFDEILLGFSDNHAIVVQKHATSEDLLIEINDKAASKKQLRYTVRITLKKNSRVIKTWSSESNEGGAFSGRVYQILERETPLDRFDHDEWYDGRTNTIYTTEEALSKYFGPTTQGAGKGIARRLYKLPPQIAEFFDALAVKFVQTQRLTITDGEGRPRVPRRVAGYNMGPRQSTVVEFSQHLVGLIDQNLADNSKISSELDRTFPKRVLERADDHSVTSDDLLAKYRDQTILRNRLAEVALLNSADDITLEGREFDATERRVLLTYLEDAEQKLGTFKDTLEKITLLRRIINERFLFKTLRIDPKDGFVFEGDQGGTIAPGQLSSGEQHELVLLYELLFRTAPGAVVLIDEPEISLHVKWQREFLSDMLAVANLSNVRFIIATHSPQVVGKWHEKAEYLAPEVDWQ